MTLTDSQEENRKAAPAARNHPDAEAVLDRLRDNGFRITRQRKAILRVILEDTCSSSKEIYAKARRIDPTVGFATVYRMISLLEDLGLISRKNSFRITEKPVRPAAGDSYFCTITLRAHTTVHLTYREWSHVVKTGLQKTGHASNQSVDNISFYTI